MKSTLDHLNFTGKVIINLSAAAAVGFMAYVYETDYRKYAPDDKVGFNRMLDKEIMGDAAYRKTAGLGGKTSSAHWPASPTTFQQRQATASDLRAVAEDYSRSMSADDTAMPEDYPAWPATAHPAHRVDLFAEGGRL